LSDGWVMGGDYGPTGGLHSPASFPILPDILVQLYSRRSLHLPSNKSQMGTLSNKTILFSGIFPGHDRAALEAQAVAAGAKLLSGVSKNLNYLVAGEKMGPAKHEKANELGVPIITLQDFFDMLPDGGAAPAIKAILLPDLFKEVKAKLPQVTFLNIEPSTLSANEKNIIKAIGKPLPEEIADFYRQCDGFRYDPGADPASGLFDDHINSLSALFDDFKPLQKLTEDYVDDELYLDDPFYDQMWYEWAMDELDEPAGKKMFNRMRRQKQLVWLNAFSKCITIDFSEGDYQLYYFDLKGELYPLQMTFTEFVRGFAYLGCVGHWYSLYMKKDQKRKTEFHDVTWEHIEELMPGFKREMIN
jgi:hypothetical protein